MALFSDDGLDRTRRQPPPAAGDRLPGHLGAGPEPVRTRSVAERLELGFALRDEGVITADEMTGGGRDRSGVTARERSHPVGHRIARITVEHHRLPGVEHGCR